MVTGKDDFILATKLKKLSLEKGISIKDLSVRSQVPLKTIYGWLAGSHPRSLIDVKKVARCLGVTMDELTFEQVIDSQSDLAEGKSAAGVVSSQDVRDLSRDLIEHIIKLIVKSPDHVSVKSVNNERTTIFEVDIHEDDFGPFLGAKGKHIDGLRSLIGAITAKKGIRSIITVKDEERFF